MKFLIFSILFLIFSGTTFANKKVVPVDSTINSKKFSIEFNPMLVSKLKFDNSGEQLIESKNLFSAELGIGYQQYLNSKWRIKGSLLFGSQPFNMRFSFAAPENSVFQTGPFKEDYRILDFEVSEYDVIRLFTSTELLLSKEVKQKNNLTYLIGGGIKLTYFFINYYDFSYYSHYYIDQNNPYTQLFFANVIDEKDNNIYGSLLFFNTLERKLNGHAVSLSLCLAYSPFKSLNGTYYFSNLGLNSYGSFFQRLSSISLRFSYLF